MALTVVNGTFSGSSTTPGVDFRTMMATQFATFGGNWSVVDNNYTNGTGVRSVIKNSEGFVLNVLTSTTTTDATVNLHFAQSYTDATHTLNNVGFGNTQTTVASNATGFSGINYNPTAINTSYNTPAAHGGIYFTAAGSQTNWVIVYDTNYAIIGIKDGASSGKWFYFGNAQSLVENASLTDTYPYVMALNWLPTSTFNGNTVILNSLGNNSVTIKHHGQSVPFADNFVGSPGNNATRDKYALDTTKVDVTPIIIVRENADKKATASDNSAYGWKRFQLRSMIYADEGGSVWGDTTQVNGSTYMYIGGDGKIASNAISPTLSGWVKIA